MLSANSILRIARLIYCMNEFESTMNGHTQKNIQMYTLIQVQSN